ncbi:MAG: phosphate/phosphite/phosphonate ABC transporter substrate-binding protein [Opitutales bacterium]|nr:phosphate/phosphite/phosphonate ABC transporter substrate-binding protein [Opitutales bacterium]
MNKIISILTGAALLLQACTKPAQELSVKEFQIALKPNKNVKGQREDEKILGEELSKRLGVPVNIITPSSKSIIEAGMANKTLDMGYVSSTDAISFVDNDVAEVLVAGQHESTDPKGKPYKGAYYYSVWLSLKEQNYSSIADLRGKPIAFASRTSTSGFLVPSWDLIKKGLLPEGGRLEDFFGKDNIFYGSGYVSAVEKVLEGKAEAAAVSYYVYEKDKHLNLEQRDKLKVIQRQGPVASHTFCVRKSLLEVDRAALKRALLEMVKENPELCEGLFGGKLVEVDPIEHLKAPRDAKAKVSTLKD